MSGVPKGQRPHSAASYAQATKDETWAHRLARASGMSIASRTSSPLSFSTEHRRDATTRRRSDSPASVRPSSAYPIVLSRPAGPSGSNNRTPNPPDHLKHALPPAPFPRGTLASAQLAAARSQGGGKPSRPFSAPSQRQAPLKAPGAGYLVQSHPYAEHWNALAAAAMASTLQLNSAARNATSGALFGGHDGASALQTTAQQSKTAAKAATDNISTGCSDVAASSDQLPQDASAQLQDAGKPQWSPPSRANIECSFLSRLSRAAAH